MENDVGKTDRKNKTSRRTFNQAERKSILERTNFKCAHCGRVLDVENMTVEHIFPIDKGGGHGEFNVVALCIDCNEAKSNSVYNLRDYYKHIDEEYIAQYEECLHESMAREMIKKRTRVMMAEDVRIYKAYNMAYYRMIASAMKKDKKKALQIIETTCIKIKMEIAFDAESEEIFEFLNKIYRNKGKTNRMYDNEFKVRELIRYGQVFTLRKPDKSIKGVLGLFNVSRHNIEMPVQVANLAECQEKDIIHLITLFEIEDTYMDVVNNIFVDLMRDFGLSNTMYITFKEDSEQHILLGVTDKILNIPFKFRGYDGYVQCYTGEGERQVIETIEKCEKHAQSNEDYVLDELKKHFRTGVKKDINIKKDIKKNLKKKKNMMKNRKVEHE